MATKFWSNKTDIIEPKRKYRFKVQITAFGDQDVVWWAKSVTIPSYTITHVTHKFLDNQYHFPGHVEWNEVSVKMVDPVSPDAVFLTHDILFKSGYAVPKSKNGTYATMSKNKSAVGAGMTGVTISQLNADGGVLEVWTLTNPFLTGVEFGELVYEGDDLREIDMKMRYDWAECQRYNADGTAAQKFDPLSGSV
jgi:hypothetical protein